MLNFLKRHKSSIATIILLLISILGLIYTKERLEDNAGLTNLNQRFFLMFQILFVSTIVFSVVDWLFKKWKEYQLLKNDKLKADLVNLKNQISPHFFFNTLNNLYGLIKKDSRKAQEFVLKLSELMRYSIYSSDTEQVALHEEIDYLKNFISLHQIRHYKEVTIQFKEDIENDNLRLYPMLLIILVENAFKHGVEKLIDQAEVHLELTVKNSLLKFSVSNNFDHTDIDTKKGIGLTNLKKRLDLLYTDKYRLSTTQEQEFFKADLEIAI